MPNESRETRIKGSACCEWPWMQVGAPGGTLWLCAGCPQQRQPAGLAAAGACPCGGGRGSVPSLAFPRAETQAACRALQKLHLLEWVSVKQARIFIFFFFWLSLFFFFFFPPCKCLNCSRSSYIPNTVILSAALHTALLFKELPWILTALQAGNPVGPLLSCLLI